MATLCMPEECEVWSQKTYSDAGVRVNQGIEVNSRG